MAVEKRETLNVPQRGEVWIGKHSGPDADIEVLVVRYDPETKSVAFVQHQRDTVDMLILPRFCEFYICAEPVKQPEKYKGMTAEQWWAAYVKQGHEIEQILGKALGYPPLFPVVSQVDDGMVCVGEHTCETVAMEAAQKLKDWKMEMEQVEKLARSEGWSEEMNMLPWHLIEAVLLKERRDKQQYIDMLAKVTAPILVPLVDSLGAFLRMFNERGPELLKEMEKLKHGD